MSLFSIVLLVVIAAGIGYAVIKADKFIDGTGDLPHWLFVLSGKKHYFIVGFMVCLFGYCAVNMGNNARTKSDGTYMTDREAKIQAQFSGWDGSHKGLTERVKSSMKDPSSYEHIETVYRDMGDHLYVTMRFRGNNSFGAKVISAVTANVYLDSGAIELIGDKQFSK